MRTRLGGCEGRCRGVEAALAHSEAARRDAEARLSSVALALRRVCGVQPDGSVQPQARRRLASPARRYSPHRGRDHSEDRNEIIDVDPEMIKKGIRNLMHEVCQIEREKDDYKSQLTVLKKQLKDATEQQGKGEGRLQSLNNNLRSLQEEKSRLQSVLGQKEAQMTALNESVQTKTVEISNLRDKITSLEATLSSINEDKVQNENKSENLRVQLAERVQEVGQLREALAAAEGRAARLDVRRAQLEGDVQRAAVAARDRDQALKVGPRTYTAAHSQVARDWTCVARSWRATCSARPWRRETATRRSRSVLAPTQLHTRRSRATGRASRAAGGRRAARGRGGARPRPGAQGRSSHLHSCTLAGRARLDVRRAQLEGDVQRAAVAARDRDQALKVGPRTYTAAHSQVARDWTCVARSWRATCSARPWRRETATRRSRSVLAPTQLHTRRSRATGRASRAAGGRRAARGRGGARPRPGAQGRSSHLHSCTLAGRARLDVRRAQLEGDVQRAAVAARDRDQALKVGPRTYTAAHSQVARDWTCVARSWRATCSARPWRRETATRRSRSVLAPTQLHTRRSRATGRASRAAGGRRAARGRGGARPRPGAQGRSSHLHSCTLAGRARLDVRRAQLEGDVQRAAVAARDRDQALKVGPRTYTAAHSQVARDWTCVARSWRATCSARPWRRETATRRSRSVLAPTQLHTRRSRATGRASRAAGGRRAARGRGGARPRPGAQGRSSHLHSCTLAGRARLDVRRAQLEGDVQRAAVAARDRDQALKVGPRTYTAAHSQVARDWTCVARSWRATCSARPWRRETATRRSRSVLAPTQLHTRRSRATGRASRAAGGRRAARGRGGARPRPGAQGRSSHLHSCTLAGRARLDVRRAQLEGDVQRAAVAARDRDQALKVGPRTYTAAHSQVARDWTCVARSWRATCSARPWRRETATRRSRSVLAPTQLHTRRSRATGRASRAAGGRRAARGRGGARPRPGAQGRSSHLHSCTLAGRARLDVRRAQLEGDVQRAAVAARDRDQALKVGPRTYTAAHSQVARDCAAPLRCPTAGWRIISLSWKLQERCEGYQRTIASLEDRCTSLKGTVEQLSTSLQKAATAESELRAELSKTQRMLNEAKNNEGNALDKLRQLQKNVANCENERRVLSEKLESAKSALSELKRLNCTLEDQVHRLTNQLANIEVQRADLESQLRMTTWDGKESNDSGELERELHALQRERSELKAKNDALQDTVRKLEAERRMVRPSVLRSKSHDRTEKSVYYSSDLDSGADSTKDSRGYKDYKDYKEVPCKEKPYSSEFNLLELENRELKMKIRRLEKELADKESELAMARNRYFSDKSCGGNRQDIEQYRQAALQAERLLEAREASHRQQIMRLENQLSALRSQLSAEIRRRQAYVSRSGRAARDVQRLRTALGDSLRAVEQDPALDSYTLEHEARKLDSTLTHSLPPLNDSFDSSK
ncbi:unnamed protein product [Euphydryas editha]|uniref:Rootletin n=2 Tax=Euphydryas editha TaxID=104508 RepID=A0AAU9TH63_EUPED|nr:unnamed protein product [Euphydryas editha]